MDKVSLCHSRARTSVVLGCDLGTLFYKTLPRARREDLTFIPSPC